MVGHSRASAQGLPMSIESMLTLSHLFRLDILSTVNRRAAQLDQSSKSLLHPMFPPLNVNIRPFRSWISMGRLI
jgi:hypothetical protein